MMPKQKPGKSEQVVQTPPEFLAAVKTLLHIERFTFDLAADKSNTVAEHFYTEEDDAIIQNWVVPGWGWCNPPYGDLEPWVAKAESESWDGAKTVMLVPASVGSSWWGTFVAGTAYVHFLHPRLTFVGHKSPYPKDLALLLYAPYLVESGGYNYWEWK